MRSSRIISALSCASIALLLLAGSTAMAQRSAGHPALKMAPAASEHRLLIGYFPQWGLYGDTPYTVKGLAESKAAGVLDQINYAQGFVTGGRCSIADPNADVNYTFTAENSITGKADAPDVPLRGNFHQLIEFKRLYPKLKILISLEGRASDFAADAQPAQQKRL